MIFPFEVGKKDGYVNVIGGPEPTGRISHFPEETSVGKNVSSYKFEKRKKEIARQKKQEEKRQRQMQKKQEKQPDSSSLPASELNPETTPPLVPPEPPQAD